MPGVLLDDPVDVDSLLTTQKMYSRSPMHVIIAGTDQMENCRETKTEFVDKLLGIIKWIFDLPIQATTFWQEECVETKTCRAGQLGDSERQLVP